MKSIITFFFLLLFVNATIAQIKVGLPAGNADPSAILDASNKGSVNKGFLAPQVALTSTSVWGLAGTTTVDGMLVWNTATAGTGSSTAVSPGMYYWYISQWISFALPPSSSVATATFNCNAITNSISPTTSGFTNGQAYSGSVTAPYTSATNGSYPGDSVTISGIRLYHAAGLINSASGNIVYAISGTFNGTTGTYNNFGLTLPGAFACSAGLPGQATYIGSSLSCIAGTPAAGTYAINVATTAANTKNISVTPATAGAYTISTAAVNGVSFSGSGVFTAAQVTASTAVTVTLTATGTPTAAGSPTFTVTAGAQTCTFSLTINNAATFACGAATQSQNPTGAFTNNSAYSGTYTIPYTAGNGIAYASVTQTINGLTLTRSAGTYAAGGGNVVYTLSGTFTGTTGSSNAYTTSECSSTVNFGIDNIRASLSTSQAAYDAAANNSWLKITAAEYANAQGTTVTNTTTSNYTNTMMANATPRSQPGPDAGVVLTNTNDVLPANNYLYAFSFKTASTTPSSITANSLSIGTANTATGIYTNLPAGVSLPAFTATVSTQYYFILKRNITTNTSLQYLGVFTANINSMIGADVTNAGAGKFIPTSGTVPSATASGGYDLGIGLIFQFLSTSVKQW